MQDMTLDTFQTDGYGSREVSEALRDALETAREYAVRPSGWLVFTGAYGCGKTHLAAAIANYRVEQGLPVLFVVVPDLLDYLRAAYAPNSPVGYDERFEQVRNVPLLILDDLGTQHATPWAAEKLYQILNYRYNAELPTIITTNQSLDAMDPRLASRLRDKELVHTIPIYAPDRRGRGAGKGEMFGSLSLYEDKTFETFGDRRDELDPSLVTELRKVIRRAKAYAQTPVNWLLLRGGSGVGKTHLAAAVANKVVRSGILALFVVVPDLLDHLRATFQPGSAVTYDERFNEVRRARLLVLDDLGTQSATPWAQEKLFQILNHRHIAGLPTVLTVSDDGWERLDERLKSRLLDNTVCATVDIEVPSYRGKPQVQNPRRTTRRRT
ncbi:MAG: hypothetical protein A2Y73_04980 [Chloroflexi bacterium RBG_13_56_8]|nr:MAG: hypothetical protein A2Y73_04980 [Chloroflexi bacterium RBG_13_56_8]